MKSIFTSKMFWLNLAATSGAAIEMMAGSGILGPKVMLGLGVANIFLRSVTKDPVTWK